VASTISRTSGLAMAVLTMAAALLMSESPAQAGLSTTFTVNSTGDQPDANLADSPNRCDVNLANPGRQCTLRAAIQEANNTAGADRIEFSIGGSAGVKTIRPDSDLPNVTEALFIDGYSQPGARRNTQQIGNNAVLRIQLDGTNADLLGLRIEASNCTVRGLVINRFAGGIALFGNSNRVAGNFIGTNAGGTQDLGNFFEGVGSSGANNTIGGTAPAARNLISGNGEVGFETSGTGDQVLGNYIGTDRSGTQSLGNDQGGVWFFSANNVVGGPADAANVIAFNGGAGVTVFNAGSTGNRILRNSIFSNVGLGIDLSGDGRTANDPAPDADTGPNNLQNWPVLNSARTGARVTRIRGTLESAPSQSFILRFFSTPPGSPAEGKGFLGAKSVETDPAGHASFTFIPNKKVPIGRRATATATDSGGNTSEFSNSRRVAAP
jgi:CSLREA domain-containing protein